MQKLISILAMVITVRMFTCCGNPNVQEEINAWCKGKVIKSATLSQDGCKITIVAEEEE